MGAYARENSNTIQIRINMTRRKRRGDETPKRKRYFGRYFLGFGCVFGSVLTVAMVIYAGYLLLGQVVTAQPVEPGSSQLLLPRTTRPAPPTRVSGGQVFDLAPTATPNGGSDAVDQPTTVPDPINFTSAEFGGGSGRIAYVSDENGNFDIYVANIDGSDRLQLTESWFGDWRPVWSPDGSRIVFHSRRDGNWEIYIMAANGENKVNISNNSADDSFPNWSPDGTRVVFHSNRGGNFDIYVVNADGENAVQLTDDGSDEYGPSWSPDGSTILFTRQLPGGREIFAMNADGSEVRQLTDAEGGSFFPTWSADGSQILFHTDRDGNYEIYMMRADGTELKRLTNNDVNDFFPALSPDGQWIMYHSNTSGGTEGNRDIVMISVDQLQEQVIAADAAQERMPTWQP